MHCDEYWMRQAMLVAQQAQARGEVPVGAIIVRDNKCLAQSGNQSIIDHDPTAHAEISAIRSAAKQINNYRLLGTTLYVTLEPCMMCAGAMLHARIQRLVFGAYDHRTGVAGGCFDWLLDEKHLHKITITGWCDEE
jgi:tRNA(adenine34) deaminase